LRKALDKENKKAKIHSENKPAFAPLSHGGVHTGGHAGPKMGPG